MSEYIRSRYLQLILICLGAFVLIIGTFWVGVNVGIHKSRRFSAFCDTYGRGLENRHPGFPRGFPTNFSAFSGEHAVVGKILSKEGSSLVIQGKDNLEQNILVTSSTEIRIGRDRKSLEDLEPNTQVAVFGKPTTDARIEAVLIRAFIQP